MNAAVKPCAVCSKKTERECSHIDCPNRRPVMAGGNIYGVRSADEFVVGNSSAWFKTPTTRD